MALGITLLASNQLRPMKNIRYWLLKKRETLHMGVKPMAKILPKSMIPASRTTLLFSLHGYMQQGASWIIGEWSMWVFSMSRKFLDIIKYLPLIMSTFTPNTVFLSGNYVIASNCFYVEDIILSHTQNWLSMMNMISCHNFGKEWSQLRRRLL